MQNNLKSNTVLLIVLIILVGVGIWVMLQKKDVGNIENDQKQVSLLPQKDLIKSDIEKLYTTDDCTMVSVNASTTGKTFLVSRTCKATDSEWKTYCGGLPECYIDGAIQQIVVDKNNTKLMDTGRIVNGYPAFIEVISDTYLLKVESENIFSTQPSRVNMKFYAYSLKDNSKTALTNVENLPGVGSILPEWKNKKLQITVTFNKIIKSFTIDPVTLEVIK